MDVLSYVARDECSRIRDVLQQIRHYLYKDIHHRKAMVTTCVFRGVSRSSGVRPAHFFSPFVHVRSVPQ